MTFCMGIDFLKPVKSLNVIAVNFFQIFALKIYRVFRTFKVGSKIPNLLKAHAVFIVLQIVLVLLCTLRAEW